ncbi:UNVERIFIED_CONTAM: putative pectinesterase 29, partial [Sesamum radiatum]
ERVRIPYDKPFIYLKGEGQRRTYVVWDGHDSTATSATFTSQADNTIAKHITFINSYNSPGKRNNPMRPAVAAMIQGDKSAFHRCGFLGLQDTLWDEQGRHYFRHCSIQGAVDFIFGAGQSIYEGCTITVVGRALNGVPGYITAQGRSHAQDTNGFVFRNCKIVGNGKAFLGRPWREYARVVFYNTSMSSIVVPQGWDAWFSAGRE